MSAPAHYDAYSGGWYGQNCDDASTSSSSYRPRHCVVRSSNRDTVTQQKDAHSGGLYVNHCVNWRNCRVLPHPFRSHSNILFQESISLYTFNWSLWFLVGSSLWEEVDVSSYGKTPRQQRLGWCGRTEWMEEVLPKKSAELVHTKGRVKDARKAKFKEEIQKVRTRQTR